MSESESLSLNESVQSVVIFSMGRKGNIVPGDIGWPIIQKREFISPGIFWNLIKVGGGAYHLQLDISKRYLAPGGGRNSCVLREQPFAWKMDLVDGRPLRICEASNPSNVLQSGYRFADPADAYAVVSQRASGVPAENSWIIQRVRNPDN